MTELTDKLTDKLDIKLNQNLWALTLGLAALGVAEQFKLNILLVFAIPLAGFMLVCVTVSMIFYTIEYCKRKKKKWKKWNG